MSESVFLAGAVRTPIGGFGGSLAALSAVELATHAGRAALRRAGLDPAAIERTLVGHARQAGCGPNPGRQVAIACGVPIEAPALTINQACLSGMQSVMQAARQIRVGEAEAFLCIGTESMSRVPYLFEAGRFGPRMGDSPLIDAMYRDGFFDPISGQLMGKTAETLAGRHQISRQEQDSYAARSQNRCQSAIADGRFDAEIEPVTVPGRRGDTIVSKDEHPRAGVTAENLSRLRPVFDKDGTVTAGNSCGITDGAAAVVVLSADAVHRYNIEPQAELMAWQESGVDPAIMGIGPVPATQALLQRQGINLDAVDLVEVNEAFAAQVLAVDRELGIDPDRLNVNGGAIALGHPIGCSGLRILVTLLHEMERRDVARGLATLCVSGGLGGAVLVERGRT
jgi:acetyl-CoA C-acetyltransferase